MAAQRCSLCGISYPTIGSFQNCPIHETPTDYIQNADPSPDWRKQLSRLIEQKERAEELTAAVPLAKGVETYHDPAIGPNVLFVNQGDLQRAGVRLSRMVPEQFHLFALEDGWIYETQGWDMARRRWWVEQVIRSEGEASQATMPAAVPLSTEHGTH